MGNSSRRKTSGGDGYREIFLNQKVMDRPRKTRSNDPIEQRKIDKEKELFAIKRSEIKKRKVSDRAAKLTMPRASGH